MKTIIPLAFLLVEPWASAEPASKADYAVSGFRDSFAVYQASIKDAPPVEEPLPEREDRETIKLESFSVVGSIARRDLENAIRDHAIEQAATEIERSFSWKRGGLIASKKIGSVTADLGLWPKLESSYTSGAFGTANIKRLRVDLLHLRW
jgi:hypothetical protein